VAAPEVSVVMPCLNEAATIAECVTTARRALGERGIVGEIIVADNGSTDGSQAIALEAGARVVPVEERGYGAALTGGIAAARGTYVVIGDADGSYDFGISGRFLDKLREGYDLVVGNRFKGGVQRGAMPFLNRYLGNPILSGLGRLFFRCGCSDLHCGMRAFRREAVLAMDLRTTGMEYASEMVVKATLGGFRVTETPTTLVPDGRGRRPHLRPWRDGWRHLRFLLLFSPNWLFLYPGITLILAGLVMGGLVLPGPLRVGRVVFDVHTLLLAAAAILVGAQAVFFALATRLFAVSEGLMPASPTLARCQGVFRLEVGLAIGGLLALAGAAGSTWAVALWGEHSFGALNPIRMLRLVIPSATALTLGCQIVFSSFLFSALNVTHQHGARR